MEYSQALVALFPVASDDVVKSVKKFHDFMGPGAQPEDPNEGIRKWADLYATMIYEMRKDAFVVKTELGKEQLAELLLWYVDVVEETPHVKFTRKT